MQTLRSSFAILPDQDLLQLAKQLAARERAATVALIALLMEIDARRLHLGEGCGSLFAYCIRILRLSEHAAYHRIEAARAARRFPVILDRLADGSMTLTNVTLLAPHLTADNVEAVLAAARHRSKREVERQVSALAPRPDVPASIRKHPAPAAAPALAAAPQAAPVAPRAPGGGSETGAASQMSPSAPAAGIAPVPAAAVKPPPTRLEGGEAWHAPSIAAGAPATRLAADDVPAMPAILPAPAPVGSSASRRPVVAPLSADRYKLQVTISGETVQKLRRIQDLTRHTVPDGDPAAIVDRALTLLLAHVERTRLAATDRPRASRQARRRSRYIPAAVRREVWRRDEGQCTFVGRNGMRCGERGFLQFHHLEPYALGGEATVDAVSLRCAAHNRYEAEQEFGVLPSVVREVRPPYATSMQPWTRCPIEAARAAPRNSARSGPSSLASCIAALASI